MRATYQLNADKLEYNFRVLKERDAENRDTVNNQKAKIKRMKEVLQY
jgi:dynein regulatory complex protein 1